MVLQNQFQQKLNNIPSQLLSPLTKMDPSIKNFIRNFLPNYYLIDTSFQ